METTNSNIPAAAPKGPLLFSIAALVMLCLATGWLALKPYLLAEPQITPESTAWVYLIIYGFALSGLYGLVYRGVSVLSGMRLFSSKMVFLHVVFHLAGVILLILSAYQPDQPPILVGQGLLACGVLTFLLNLAASFRREGRPNVSSAFLVSSLLWLGIMIVAGIPFAKTSLIPFFEGTDWAPATLMLCLTGAVLNGIFGVSLGTTARRIGSRGEGLPLSWLAFILLNAGVAWLFAAITFGPPVFILICAGVYLLGQLVFLAGFTVMLQRRDEEVLEWDSKILYTSLWMLPVCLGLFVFAVWTRQVQAEAPLKPEAAALLALVLGVCVPAMVATFYQISSLLRGEASGEEAPLMVKLSQNVLLASFFNYAIGVLMLIPGAWLGIEKMLGLGTLFLIVGSVGFLGNFLFMLRPANRPASEQAAQAA